MYYFFLCSLCILFELKIASQLFHNWVQLCGFISPSDKGHFEGVMSFLCWRMWWCFCHTLDLSEEEEGCPKCRPFMKWKCAKPTADYLHQGRAYWRDKTKLFSILRQFSVDIKLEWLISKSLSLTFKYSTCIIFLTAFHASGAHLIVFSFEKSICHMWYYLPRTHSYPGVF